jgi:hypothetical protein
MSSMIFMHVDANVFVKLVGKPKQMFLVFRTAGVAISVTVSLFTLGCNPAR